LIGGSPPSADSSLHAGLRPQANSAQRYQLIRPACTMASRTAAWAFSLAGTMGSRTFVEHLPISDSAYLIGAGDVSTKRLM